MQPHDPTRIPVAGEPSPLMALLDALPDESNRAFETQLTSLVGKKSTSIDELRDILNNPTMPAQLRYAAFFAIATSIRRRKEPSTLLDLLALHKEFAGRGTFDHLYSMALRLRNGPGDLRGAFNRARLAKHKLPNHTGVLHNFAEIVITAVEEDEPLPNRDEALEEAATALRTALLVEPHYAKFHDTFGRLAALQGDYGEARMRIAEAVDLEDSSEDDYWARVTEYQFHMLQIRLRESTSNLIARLDSRVTEVSAEVQKAVEETRRTLDQFDASVKEAQSRHLEFLAFFSAIVALVIAGIQIANRPAMKEVAATLLLLGGVLLTSFAALGLLVRDRTQRSLLVLAVGGAMCAWSMFLW